MSTSQDLKYKAPKFDRAILNHIFETLESITDQWWIDHGTLLGLTRDANFIAWDSDIDIGMWDKDPTHPSELAKELGKTYKYVHHDKICNCVKTKFFDNDTLWTVDIVFYTKQGDHAVKYWPDVESLSPIKRVLEKIRNIAEGNNSPTPSSKLKSTTTALLDSACRLAPKKFRDALALKLRNTIPAKLNTAPLHLLCSNRKQTINNFKVRTPTETKDYLAFRYGPDWSIPKPNWNYLQDDGGIKSS